MASCDLEGTTPTTTTTTEQLRELADNITETSAERLSLEGQLRQALISLESYIDSDAALPKYALSNAKGIVFLSLIKCGFVIEGCLGVGFILCQIGDTNEWSCPSSIVCGGLSIGFLAGATKIDYIMCLPNEAAISAFMTNEQIRIGTDLSLSLLSVGRDLNANVGFNAQNLSILYSYSHSKGLYGGISLHGKIIKVWQKCNESFYGFQVANERILKGTVHLPISYNCGHYSKIVFILQSYQTRKNAKINYKIESINPFHGSEHKNDECVRECQCKLCQKHKLFKFEKTNPFHCNEENTETEIIKTPQKQNKHNIINNKPLPKRRQKSMTVNALEKKAKYLHKRKSKTVILKQAFLERTPPPNSSDSNEYKFKNENIEINGESVTITAGNNPWIGLSQTIKKSEHKTVNTDPYALSVRPWDSLIEQNIKKRKKTDTKTEKNSKEIKYKRSALHYSDFEISSYSLNKYDTKGYRIRTFDLLFQISFVSYQTQLSIAGKLVSKQYILNWPNTKDCKAVIIVTSKQYSTHYISDPYSDSKGSNDSNDSNDSDYELRLVVYDQRDDDVIVYKIELGFKQIPQIVSALNGAFILSSPKPWIVLESLFCKYGLKMYESMIDISAAQSHLLRFGDLIRCNFGSLCMYGLFVGRNEIICFRRRFPNNGSSAFKKYRLFLMLFNGRASKKINMKYCSFSEFIYDCSRIEVIYYPLPAVAPLSLVKKALIATNNKVHNCVVEYSPMIQSKFTLSTKEMIEESVLTVIDGITATVHTISEVVTSPVNE